MKDSGINIGMNANKVRKILLRNGYQEVVSPILRNYDSAVNPRFSVQSVDSDDKYLRDCMETPLRKHISTITPKIFEIGPCFRQGEVDDTHRREFYMMELYSANGELQAMKTLTEDIVSAVIGNSVLSISISLVQEMTKDLDIDIRYVDTEELIATISSKYSHISGERKYQVVNQYIDHLEQSICVNKDVLYFLEEYPVCTIDSAARYGKTNTIQRFEAFYNGLEIAHAFVDCMDASDIRIRASDASINDEETQELIQLTEQDYFLPTVGLGIGINRLCMI